jgi:hypothetical protein
MESDRGKRLWAISQGGRHWAKFAEAYADVRTLQMPGQAVGSRLMELGTLKGIVGRSEKSVIFSTSANL